MEEYLSREDCFIEREGFGRAVLMRHDGEFRVVMPGEWTDEQVWEALKIANTFYGCGVEAGKMEKIHEIKRILLLQV
jgi:hypothetical protein